MSNHNKLTAQPVIPVTSRKFSRRFLKNQNGNNKIAQAWRRFQVVRFGGLIQYIAMRKAKAPQPQRRELFYTLKNWQ